ncbi:MAG: ATP-binding protein [Planctomycetota bacterium]
MCTEELGLRPARPPDLASENAALANLTRTLADSPQAVLQTLADTILSVLGCGSCVVSLVSSDGTRFHWAGVAGEWGPQLGRDIPLELAPCGDVLDRDEPMLLGQFERRYRCFEDVSPRVDEALLVPFHVAGKGVGTIWAITHADRPVLRRFDREDLRMLQSLSAFAAAAYRVDHQLEALREQDHERHESSQALHELNGALLVSSIRQHELAELARKGDALVRESNARFETLFDASPVGMYLVDADLRIRLVSAKARPIFGSIEGLIGSEFERVIHVLWPQATADDVVARFRHTLETGEAYSAPDFSELRRDIGEREYYDWKLHRIALPDGRYGVVCYFIDTSDRVLAQRALRASETRYRRLFQSAKDGILILDAKSGKIIDANAIMSGLLGRELPSLLGRELHEIGMFADEKASRGAFAELQHNGYLRYDHLPIHKPGGETTHVEFVSNVYSEGERLLAQCNVRDITVRAAMEQQIKEQAHSLAEQARRKDEFLAMLSHELSNPLAPIRSASYLLRQHASAGESAIQRQAREIIDRQVANLTKLVGDLLEVSRVVSGRVRLDLQRVDLKRVLEHALQTVGPLFEQRKQSVTLELCSDPLWANADPARLEEVMVNLLNNAAKYTPDAGTITLSCERREAHALLRVVDNGVGLDKELLPRIFDLFTQADRSLDRAAGGLGIGLALAHRLVTLHNGTIEARSAGPGKGSEFTVTLPLIPTPTPTPTSLPAAAMESAGVEGLGSADSPHLARVLVVDDNVDSVTMLSGTLRHKGYTVRGAHTGPDAVTLALQWRPDIVLLDIGLPGFDGYEVARRLRAAPALAGVTAQGIARSRMKLIALTGYGQDADITLAREAGFDGHLVKPCDFDELERMMGSTQSRM